ncbi:MAG: L-lysine 6-transaminase, partial [Ignavibacteriae bacterium]
VSSRINSTWGGNLVDMVRSKYIMKVIDKDNLVENANERGKYLLKRLNEIQFQFPELINNVRGLGLMRSFDLPSTELRDEFRAICEKEKLLILGCGEKSVRFRPPLNISDDELEEGLIVIEKVLNLLMSN